MARDLSPRCKAARREGTDLFLVGYRPIDTKCRLETPPGQAQKKGRTTIFGTQLREKKKVRRIYGILEKKFSNYFKKASRMKGATGETLLLLLETRLDNVVYRLGFGCTRAESRQLVNHSSVLVNGKIINIPSYTVAVGDVISIREKAKNQERIKSALEQSKQRTACEWIEMDIKTMTGTFKRIPDRSELSSDINEHLIVELYSK